MSMNTQHIVQYRTVITDPDGSPADSGGQPDGQGPPEDAAPSDRVANILANTPAADDARLAGMSTDDDGNPQGQPAREYRVEDRIDADGRRVTEGTLPVTAAADAQAIFDDILKDASGADEHAVRAYETPLGAVSTEEVQEWYEANPDQQPTDDDGEPFVPTTWDPRRHLLDESTG